MIFNHLGSTGIQVSRICLGMMSYGSNRFQSWVLAPAEGVRFVRMALESGINFFDTADFYSQGQSEETLGRAVAQLTKRENVVLATKVGMPVGPGPNDRGLSRKHIFAAVDASLRRLKTDYIDLYQLHNPDPETPIEETLSAMADVVRAGKARYIGASNYASWELALANRAMHTDHSMRIATTQMEYNLTFREVERARRVHIGALAAMGQFDGLQPLEQAGRRQAMRPVLHHQAHGRVEEIGARRLERRRAVQARRAQLGHLGAQADDLVLECHHATDALEVHALGGQLADAGECEGAGHYR